MNFGTLTGLNVKCWMIAFGWEKGAKSTLIHLANSLNHTENPIIILFG